MPEHDPELLALLQHERDQARAEVMSLRAQLDQLFRENGDLKFRLGGSIAAGDSTAAPSSPLAACWDAAPHSPHEWHNPVEENFFCPGIT